MEFAGHGPDAQRRGSNHHGLGCFELADNEGDEIGRHFHRIGEHDFFFPGAGQRSRADHARV